MVNTYVSELHYSLKGKKDASVLHKLTGKHWILNDLNIID